MSGTKISSVLSGKISVKMDKPNVGMASLRRALPTSTVKMMPIGEYAQWSDQFDYESVVHDEDPMA